MFAARGGRTTGSNPNRWLLLAGAGLLALGVVLRLMMDIGRTAASAPDDAPAPTDSAPMPIPAPAAEVAAATRPDTTVTSRDTVAPVAPAAPMAPAAAVPAGPGPWVVQLGVFGSPDNAKRVVSEAQRLGVAALAVPVGTAGRVRVRTSGYASREAAQAAADSLGRHLRLNAVVLQP